MKYVKNKSLGLLLLSLLVSSCSKYDFTDVFSTLPSKPHPGETVTILYNPTGTVLDSSNQILATIRTYGDRNYQPASMFSMPNNVANTEEYTMEKHQDGWTIQISVPDTVVGFVVTLHNENDTDHNGGLGYWVPLYSSDQYMLPGAEAGYPAALVRRGWGAELDRTLYADTLLSFYENEFFRNPEKKSGFAFSHFSALRKSKGADGTVEIEKILEAMSDTSLWTEEHLFFLSAWYGAVKNQEKADYFKTKSQEKYPSGRWVQRLESGKIYKKEGSSEKKKFLDDFIAKYPNYSADLSYIYGLIAGEYIKEGSYALALEYLNALNGKVWSERPIFYAVNNIEKIENEEGQQLIEIINKSVTGYRQEFDKPTSSKPPLIITSIWEENRAVKLALALDALGLATGLVGGDSDATLYFEEAYNLSNKTNKQINEHFAATLFKSGSTYKAKVVLEESISGAIQSPKMEEILKEIYLEIHESDADFASYYSNLTSTALGNLKVEIESKLVTEKAPEFTLLDTDGKAVSLSDYQGKIVILDFWATWCGPCKISFPAMQKAINKYKKDDLVKFLFVNTQEKSKNKLQSITDYMSKNDFSFHVVMDDQDEVYQSYGVALLPTKIIIDTSGNIRFRSLGFTGATELLDELDILISLLKPNIKKMGLGG